MKAFRFALAASTLLATAAASAQDYYDSGYSSYGAAYSGGYGSGCASCGYGGTWNPSCYEPYCPRDYLWADYCATKDCRPVYRQVLDHLAQAARSQRHGCGGAACETGACGEGCANCSAEPSRAGQIGMSQGAWSDGEPMPSSPTMAPRAPQPRAAASDDSPLDAAIPLAEGSPSDAKFPVVKQGLPPID